MHDFINPHGRPPSSTIRMCIFPGGNKNLNRQLLKVTQLIKCQNGDLSQLWVTPKPKFLIMICTQGYHRH